MEGRKESGTVGKIQKRERKWRTAGGHLRLEEDVAGDAALTEGGSKERGLLLKKRDGQKRKGGLGC